MSAGAAGIQDTSQIITVTGVLTPAQIRAMANTTASSQAIASCLANQWIAVLDWYCSMKYLGTAFSPAGGGALIMGIDSAGSNTASWGQLLNGPSLRTASDQVNVGAIAPLQLAGANVFTTYAGKSLLIGTDSVTQYTVGNSNVFFGVRYRLCSLI